MEEKAKSRLAALNMTTCCSFSGEKVTPFSHAVNLLAAEQRNYVMNCLSMRKNCNYKSRHVGLAFLPPDVPLAFFRYAPFPSLTRSLFLRRIQRYPDHSNPLSLSTS